MQNKEEYDCEINDIDKKKDFVFRHLSFENITSVAHGNSQKTSTCLNICRYSFR